MLDDCRDVRRAIRFAVSQSDDQRRAFPHAVEFIRSIAENKHKGKRSAALLEEPAQGFDRFSVIEPGKKLRRNFRIRLRAEVHVPSDEFVAEFLVVFDDPIVDENHRMLLIGVRMGVRRRHAAVSGPASVPDADVSAQAARSDKFLQLRHLAHGFDRPEGALLANGYSRRVVPAIFKALQPSNDNLAGILAADITNNSTHTEQPPQH